jgi:ketosteroid isomerase-like protein
MSVMKRKWMKSCFITLSVVLAAAFILILPMSVMAEDKPVTMETLLDRIQIEDMIVKYYVDMSAGKNHDLAMYYTEDAVLDVNGVIAAGHKAIEKLYAGTGDAPAFTGKMNMLLNNAIINVNGNTATAWVIWTGVINDDIKKAPRLLEQGNEYDELVKVDGRWYIKKRYITADSGVGPMWEKTYKPRSFR